MSLDLSILTTQSIPALWAARDEIFKQTEFDMIDVKEIDSAGVAFLVQWAKHCPNKVLCLRHSTHKARSIMRTFKLEELFSLIDNC